jgi:hypothetical protein
LEVKCVFWFYLQLLSKTLLVLRRIQGDIITNVHRSSLKYPLMLSDFNKSFNFLDIFWNNPQIRNLIKIRSVGADGWAWRS